MSLSQYYSFFRAQGVCVCAHTYRRKNHSTLYKGNGIYCKIKDGGMLKNMHKAKDSQSEKPQ